MAQILQKVGIDPPTSNSGSIKQGVSTLGFPLSCPFNTAEDMDGTSDLSLYSAQSEKKNLNQSRCDAKSKIFLGAAIFILSLAVIAGIFGLALFLFPLRSGSGAPTRGNVKPERTQSMPLDNHHVSARRVIVVNNGAKSCYSDVTNDSIPIAYISGEGLQWRTKQEFRSAESAIPLEGYKTNWNCNSSHGNNFVKGGMNFTIEDQRLHMPTCGYYYISSKILFIYSRNDEQPEEIESASHGIEVIPNCGPGSYPYHIYTYSTLERSREYSRTSTNIGEVAKICEGGSIRVVIPTDSTLCCAYGDSIYTHFSAHLINETPCS